MARLLDYADPRRTKRAWGPILFRPSRRSVGLVVLGVVVAVWVAKRHEPWVKEAEVTIGSTYPSMVPVSVTGEAAMATDWPWAHVLVCEPMEGRVLWGAKGGGETDLDPAYRFVSDVRRLLKVDRIAGQLSLVDGLSGRTGAQAKWPNVGFVDAAESVGGVAVLFYSWDTVGGAGDGVTYGLCRPFERGGFENVVWFKGVPGGAMGRISADGERVLFMVPHPGSVWSFHVFDSATGRLLLELGSRGKSFAFGPDSFTTVAMVRVGLPSRVGPDPWRVDALERHSTRTGERLSRVEVKPYVDLPRVAFFEGGRYGMMFDGRAAGAPDVVSTYDLETARVVKRLETGRPSFEIACGRFPDGRRMTIPGARRGTFEVYDATRSRPVAVVGGAGLVDDVVVSRDGEWVAVSRRGMSDGRSALCTYRRAGIDACESTLGVLGMPHVWLLVLTCGGVGFSLLMDARRAAVLSDEVVGWVSVCMVAGAWIRLSHLVVTACLGQWLWTTAPVVMACGIGLAAGSRFWRVAALWVLAALAGLSGYCVWVLWRMGLGSVWEVAVGDRSYGVTVGLVAWGLAGVSCAIVGGVGLLWRRQRM